MFHYRLEWTADAVGRLERKKGKMNGRDDREVTLEVTARRRAII